jgi:hypothetical protein
MPVLSKAEGKAISEKCFSDRHREPQSGAAIQIFWIASSPLASRNDGLCKGFFLKGEFGFLSCRSC